MKKLMIVAAAMLVMFAATASAQELSGGVKGGMNLASISNMDQEFGRDTDIKMLPGFYVGAFVEYKLNDRFGISPEFVYSMQGVKAEASGRDEWDGVDYKYEGKMSLNYLNIPVLAKIYVAESFSIDVGPQFGFLLSAKEKDKATYAGQTHEADEDIKKFCNTFDMALGIGATYNIGKFMIQGRYNIGITDVAKFEDEKPSSHKALRNNVFQFGVAYRF